ncbi:DUF3710 domain-containing protein [Gordonia sp. LSe1-13]|uniref:DUF3710 domain-containing protein n=1 Tax=Gordonia sesuvii TaxID=3116777 RepID=A0ABU7MBQ0_9ACTN|nr:DUF3710 domain-containing protein [Gordonia sp. LSe1-13]
MATEPLRIGTAQGPYDIDALETPAEELGNSHLDLGSVLVPVVEGGQVTVEMSADHQPQAVYLVTPHGRINVTAFAAPKSPGQWREVVRELAESLRDEGATVSIEDGHWGREVVAVVPGGEHRFLGVDGPRWMVRCVASGPDDRADELARLARAVLAESVVRRGSDPFPPRDPLPVVLPPVLAEQVAAAQQQMQDGQGTAQGNPGAGAAGAAGAPGTAGPESAPPTVAADDEQEPTPRSSGSAMQRFRRDQRG